MRRTHRLVISIGLSAMVMSIGATALAENGGEPPEEAEAVLESEAAVQSGAEVAPLEPATTSEEATEEGDSPDPFPDAELVEAGDCSVTFTDGELIVAFQGDQEIFDLASETTGKKVNHGRIVSTVARQVPDECRGAIVSAVAQTDWGKVSDDDTGEPMEESADEAPSDEASSDEWEPGSGPPPWAPAKGRRSR